MKAFRIKNYFLYAILWDTAWVVINWTNSDKLIWLIDLTYPNVFFPHNGVR